VTDQQDAPDAAASPSRDMAELGDADLVLRARSGDTWAFGELWRRHYRSGMSVARNVSPGTDADDLVQEAYTRIYHSLQRGGGPTGSFRAYLFTSIRNTAAGWGRSRRETTIDELESMEDPSSSEQAAAESLDRGLTHQAFRSLPSRWQEVLWYSEIEGMKPGEIAPLLGMKPTAVAQLTFRAREGLREAWIQAHLRAVADDSECAWTIARLGAYARNNIGRRDRAHLETHLGSCTRCTIVASEAREVSGRLALVLIPLTVGVAGAAGYVASLQGGGTPLVALAAMPSSVVQGAVSAGSGTGVAAGSGTGVAVGTGTAGAAGAGTAGAVGTAGSAVGAAAAGTAGSAVGAAAAGTAAATGASIAAGGALTGAGMAGFAAATLVVAGTVAAAVALPPETDRGNTASVRTISEIDTTAPGTADDTTTSLAPAGPSPADIPVLPATDSAAGDDGDAPGAADADHGSGNAGADAGHGGGNPDPGDAETGGTGKGSTGGSATSGSAGASDGTDTTGYGAAKPGGVKAGTDGKSPAANPGGGKAGPGGNGPAANPGAGSTGANGGTPQSGNVNSGAGDSNGIGPAGLPAGSPSIVSSSSAVEGAQSTITLVAAGEAGATVQARVRGVVLATGAIGDDGRAVLVVQPSAQDLAIDARLELRYVAGELAGIPVSARLSALL
jgi:RNA polymerase sigma factor (sigma-70 family)